MAPEIDSTRIIRHACFGWIRSPRLAISAAWLATVGLIILAFILSCVSLHNNVKSNNALLIAASFGAVWTTTLLMVIGMQGSFILYRNASPLSIGLLLGIVFLLSQQMLILFAFLIEQSKNFDHSPEDRRLFHAMASFCFLLFVSFSVFDGFLVIFRDEILNRPVTDEYSLLDETGEAQRTILPSQPLPRKPPMLNVQSRNHMDSGHESDSI